MMWDEEQPSVQMKYKVATDPVLNYNVIQSKPKDKDNTYNILSNTDTS